MSGQTLTDRIAAAQYQLTGSDMARAVCKATTHEVMAPKKKHLECKCSPSISSLYCTRWLYRASANRLHSRPPTARAITAIRAIISINYDHSFLNSLGLKRVWCHNGLM